MTLTITMVLIVTFTVLMFLLGGVGLKTNPDSYFLVPIFFSCCNQCFVVIMSSVFISILGTIELINMENKENMDLQDKCFNYGFRSIAIEVFRSESVAKEDYFKADDSISTSRGWLIF